MPHVNDRGAYMPETSRSFTSDQKRHLYFQAKGRCQSCDSMLMPGWHADHVIPWSMGGETAIKNGQALCPSCNLRKGTKLSIADYPNLIRGVEMWPDEPQPRDWHIVANQKFFANQSRRSFFVYAWPGAGKTYFALWVASQMFAAGAITKLIILVPRTRLRGQWKAEAFKKGMLLDEKWEDKCHVLHSHFAGMVVTYAGACSKKSREYIRQIIDSEDVMVIFDEIHHCGEGEESDSAWGEAVSSIFANSRYEIALSGTPFRTGGQRVSRLQYKTVPGTSILEAIPDHEFTYLDALRQGVCRPIRVQTFNAKISWQKNGQKNYTATFDQMPDEPIVAGFDDEVQKQWNSNRYRAALQPDKPLMRQMMEWGHNNLTILRETSNDGGLFIGYDINHAEKCAEIMHKISGSAPLIAHSDTDDADETIRMFIEGTWPWLFSVGMVSEGVDAVRTGVLLYASKNLTEMAFTQAIGRGIRRSDGCLLVGILKDPRLTPIAIGIEDTCKKFQVEEIERYSGGNFDDEEGGIGGGDSEEGSSDPCIPPFRAGDVFDPREDIAIERGSIYEAHEMVILEQIRTKYGLPKTHPLELLKKLASDLGETFKATKVDPDESFGRTNERKSAPIQRPLNDEEKWDNARDSLKNFVRRLGSLFINNPRAANSPPGQVLGIQYNDDDSAVYGKINGKLKKLSRNLPPGKRDLGQLLKNVQQAELWLQAVNRYMGA